MDQRKLIRLGNSSFAIALPKNWVEKASLKKGDKVFITPNTSGELIISPSLQKINGKEEKIFIDLKGKDEEEIARDINSAYVGGNKTIEVAGEKDKIKIAKNKSKKFISLELVEETQDGAVFRDLLDIEDVGITNFMRRMDNNLKEMFTLIMEILNDKKKISQVTKELENIDKDITKFYFLIWRFMNLGVDNLSLQQNLKMNSKSLIFNFWIAYNIEHIGDDLKRATRKLEKIPDKKKKFIGIFNLLSENYDKCMKSFFEKNKDFSKQVLMARQDIISECQKLSQKKDFEAVVEKLFSIQESIYNNAKMIFYEI
jgi:phosphate uptake regulator